MMRDLALILNRKRERRGSIDFDLPEPVIEFDEFGLMKSITRSERNIAHRLIEEFMLSANECVAGYLENKTRRFALPHSREARCQAGLRFRSHRRGLRIFARRRRPAHSARADSNPTAAPAHGTGKRPREIEIPKEVHITPRMYQKLTEKIAGKPEERILSYLMLRSLKQARYSEENLGHFALAAPTLHALHLAHPPLSRLDRPPHPERGIAAPLPISEERDRCGASSRAIAQSTPRRQDGHSLPLVQTSRPHGPSRGARTRLRPDLRSKSFTTSPRNPAIPSAAPTKPNAT